MKLVTFAPAGAGNARVGAVIGTDIVDLAAAGAAAGRANVPASMKGLLRLGSDGLALARDILSGLDGKLALLRSSRPPIIHSMAEARLLPPVPDPGKFLCAGRNYSAHQRELRGTGLPDKAITQPTAFIKLASTLIGDGMSVGCPPELRALDYEPELVAVIHRPCHRVSPAEAMSYVGGITILNDLTDRALQKHEAANESRFWFSKNQQGFGPLGPYIVTLDEIGDPRRLRLSCHVNGQERLSASTGDMIFDTATIVAHYSQHLPLEPGDLVATGSPGGVAASQTDPDRFFLKPGDVVEVRHEGVGTLRTHIVRNEL
jgi:2-keto-4-pentenoate hydratase/2-oxohepta-3-ene-1,7-dioic acid hydratase in catechol pathway